MRIYGTIPVKVANTPTTYPLAAPPPPRNQTTAMGFKIRYKHTHAEFQNYPRHAPQILLILGNGRIRRRSGGKY